MMTNSKIIKGATTLLVALFLLGIFILGCKGIGYLQNDRYTVPCEYVYVDDNGKEVAGFVINNNYYEWEIEPNHPIRKGNMCKVSVFDFENGDKTDDIITSVKVLDK